MEVAILGANGKIGRRTVARMAAAEGLHPRVILRDPGQVEAFDQPGATPVFGDLEGNFAEAVEGSGAVVFTAGSGPHTGKDKTLLVDLWGAARVIRHCHERGPKRFIMVSALRAGDPDEASGKIKPYLVAKWAADEILLRSGLDFTVLRPGSLTEEAGTGRITAAEHLAERSGGISRDNVAAAIVHCLRSPGTAGKTYEMLDGDTPVEDALV